MGDVSLICELTERGKGRETNLMCSRKSFRVYLKWSLLIDVLIEDMLSLGGKHTEESLARMEGESSNLIGNK